jgi:hypothetical protein
MTLVDQLLAISAATRPGPKCILGKYLDTLPDTDRDELVAAVKHPDIKASVVARHLNTLDVSVDVQTVRDHRNGTCKGCSDRGLFPA